MQIRKRRMYYLLSFSSQDYDSSSHFGDSTTQSAQPESLTVKLKTDKQEIEEFYITVRLNY